MSAEIQASKDEFQQMINSNAWKRLEEWSQKEAENSVRLQDGKSATDLNLNIVCEDRGIRKGMAKVINQAKTFAAGR